MKVEGKKRIICIKCKKRIERPKYTVSEKHFADRMYCNIQCKTSITSYGKGFGTEFIKKVREEIQGV